MSHQQGCSICIIETLFPFLKNLVHSSPGNESRFLLTATEDQPCGDRHMPPSHLNLFHLTLHCTLYSWAACASVTPHNPYLMHVHLSHPTAYIWCIWHWVLRKCSPTQQGSQNLCSGPKTRSRGDNPEAALGKMLFSPWREFRPQLSLRPQPNPEISPSFTSPFCKILFNYLNDAPKIAFVWGLEPLLGIYSLFLLDLEFFAL